MEPHFLSIHVLIIGDRKHLGHSKSWTKQLKVSIIVHKILTYSISDTVKRWLQPLGHTNKPIQF